MSKWIKISEDKIDGKPGDGREVLVTNGHHQWVLERFRWNEGITFNESMIDGYDGFFDDDHQDPTHYRELPEFPKGGE